MTAASGTLGPRPSFIGIGAGKSGTTWLWEMLRKHPDVFLPEQKELQYFNEEWYGTPGIRNERATRGIEWYLQFFADAQPGQVCGEITPTYLWNVTAPQRIHAFDPSLRLFALLRDPTEQVFSSYLFSLQKGEMNRMSFEDALVRHSYLVDRTYYGRFIGNYLDWFPLERLKVFLYEDLVRDPRRILVEVERYIGVREFVPDNVSSRTNVTGANAYPRINRALMAFRLALKRYRLEPIVAAADKVGLGSPFRWVQGQVRPYDGRPRMNPDTEARLRATFTPDIEVLEKHIGIDLSAWKSGAVNADQRTG
jgi:hypothetical protein